MVIELPIKWRFTRHSPAVVQMTISRKDVLSTDVNFEENFSRNAYCCDFFPPKNHILKLKFYFLNFTYEQKHLFKTISEIS